jgi:hypothetical protein
MIEKILIIALVTLGYCCTFWPGMIFERIGDWMDEHAPEWLWKPLGGCYICACMWIGSLVYWVAFRDGWIDWVLCCIGAMGLNAFISESTNKPEEIETKEDKPVKVEIVSDQKQSECFRIPCKYCSVKNNVPPNADQFICETCGRLNDGLITLKKI